MNEKIRRSFERRIVVAKAVGTLFCAIILLKLGAEQTVLRDERLSLADKLMPTHGPIAAEPGPICTLEGVPLAESVVRYTIWADPSTYRTTQERDSVAVDLAETTGVSLHRIYPRLCMQHRDFCYILRRADRDVMARVASLNLPGVHILPEIGRLYPNGTMAANAIGCRGDDNIGIEGIERVWGFVLDGHPSSPCAARDPFGWTILGTSEKFIPPEPGCRVTLTIRLPLQKAVEAAMDELWMRNQPESATCTVLDPRTGDIVALSVRPNYDPNDLSNAIPERRKCRQASDVYAPGSTLKTLIVAAALDCGAITEHSTFFCPGETEVGGKPLGCWGKWREHGHGWLTPREVIAQSCNICAAEIALKLGAQRLYQYLKKMHLQETLSSGLDGELPGKVRPLDQQRIRDIANIGFGQGIDLTDLHLVAWYGALANQGRMYYPNIVREVRRADGQLIRRREPQLAGQLVKPETAKLVLSFLEEAVKNGTGRPAAIKGVRVGGKTGTAQIYDPRLKRHLEDEYIMSFVAVAPIEAPRFVVLVRLVKPKFGEHGSDTAAPTARRVIQAALRLTQNVQSYQVTHIMHGRTTTGLDAPGASSYHG
ncbi:MAG: peptidoglycan D,D-transpeptidase FtsI family protein [Candidatus Zipacnadales bacterium]